MTATTPTVSLTQDAMRELRDYMEEQGTPTAMLRVFVSPGGCSGLSYGMSVEEEADPEDLVVEQEGMRILVDQFSAMYVAGAEIDYINSLMGGGFTVRNPNAVATCACGHSFDTGENGGTAMGCGCGAH